MMKTITAIVMLVAAFTLSLYGYDSDCPNAVWLTCGEPVDGHVQGGTSAFDKNSYGGYAGGIWYTGVDHIYKIKKTTSGPFHIFLHTSQSGFNVFLANHCSKGKLSFIAGGHTIHHGTDKYIDNDNEHLPAGEYFIIVDSRDIYTNGKYSLTVTCSTLDCSTAEKIECNETKHDENNHTGTNNVSIYKCGYDKLLNYTGKDTSVAS